MHVGLGLPGWLLNTENFRFARQAGATHLVASVRGFGSPVVPPPPDGDPTGIGRSVADPAKWSVESLRALRAAVEAEGLRLEAIENFEPADWYDILLDGPQRDEQIANLKTIVRNLGSAGIPIMGYNFSLAGVWGRRLTPAARGGALTPVFDAPEEPPIRRGMIWNAVYDQELFASDDAGVIEAISHEELWYRFENFLNELVPVAEEANVKMALHPDDPPMPELRRTPRLVHKPELYDKVLGLRPSPNNCMEFCVGTLSEMPDSNIYEVVNHYGKTGRIGYVHLRNVTGKVPHYVERFIDEGDTDMLQVLRILGDNAFEGVVIPDHAPQLQCDAPWHAGMAHALGWISAALRAQGLLTG